MILTNIRSQIREPILICSNEVEGESGTTYLTIQRILFEKGKQQCAPPPAFSISSIRHVGRITRGKRGLGIMIDVQRDANLSYRLLLHCVRRAASRAACTAGTNRATSIPMIASVTSNSTRVMPDRIRIFEMHVARPQSNEVRFDCTLIEALLMFCRTQPLLFRTHSQQNCLGRGLNCLPVKTEVNKYMTSTDSLNDALWA